MSQSSQDGTQSSPLAISAPRFGEHEALAAPRVREQETASLSAPRLREQGVISNLRVQAQPKRVRSGEEEEEEEEENSLHLQEIFFTRSAGKRVRNNRQDKIRK